MKNSLMNGGWGAIIPLTAAFGVYMFFVFLPGMKDIRRMRSEIETNEVAQETSAIEPVEVATDAAPLEETANVVVDDSSVPPVTGEQDQTMTEQIADLSEPDLSKAGDSVTGA